MKKGKHRLSLEYRLTKYLSKKVPWEEVSRMIQTIRKIIKESIEGGKDG